MTRETFVIFVKALLTLAGSYLIGQNLMGQPIDNELWQVIVGVIMSGVSIYWSIKDKTYTIESIQAFVRQLLLVIGGLLLASGKITPDRLEAIIGAVVVLVPVLQSYLSKKKAEEIKEGNLNVQSLSSIPKKAA